MWIAYVVDIAILDHLAVRFRNEDESISIKSGLIYSTAMYVYAAVVLYSLLSFSCKEHQKPLDALKRLHRSIGDESR